MATKIGVATSSLKHPVEAGKAAARDALARGGLDRADLVLAFATVGYDQAAFVRGVRATTGSAPLVGCSAEGVIGEGKSTEDNFVAIVMVLQSDDLRFHAASARNLREEPQAVGAALARAVSPSIAADTLTMMTFADGLTLNFDAFHSGFRAELGQDRFVPIIGGTAGDNWAFKQTFQYHDDAVFSDGVAGVLVSGAASMAVAVTHGCLPIGKERKVTKAEGNVIYEIDHKPALEVLKEYLEIEEIDSWQKTIVNLALGFKAPGDLRKYDEHVIRYIPLKDDARGSISIPTEVEPGTSVWMTRRDHEKISAGLRRAKEELERELQGKTPLVMFQFDCAGRGKVIFRDDQKQQLVRELQATWGGVPWLGLHTYGEIGPVAGTNHFHNYTAVLAAIY